MELKDAMNKRRSIRKYQKKEVSDAMVETLIEAAIQAPTWKNSQTGRYHVVRSQQMLEKLKWEGLARFNGENAEDAPVLSVPGMARIQSEIDRSQVVTAKCSEPQVVDSDVRDGGSGVAILSSVRTETGYKAKWWIRLLNKPKSKR